MSVYKCKLSHLCRPVGASLAIVATLFIAGCGGGGKGDGSGGGTGGGAGGGRQFLDMGTAPAGGAFFTVGNALAEVLNAEKGDNNWKVTAKGTKGTQENIRRIDSGELKLGLANAAITYFAVRGEEGWEKPYPVRAVMTLAPNVAMFISKADGPQTIAELKGKRVVVGPSGAGFEFFLKPLLEAHGVTYDDFIPSNNTQSAAVDELGDGAVDAAFLGGAVPTPSITQACSTHDIHFIPFDEAAMAELIEKYPFFHPATIKKEVYSDLTEDFQGLNVGSMHLITHADVDEDTIYQLTKIIYENAAELQKKHASAKAINEKVVVRNTGTEFHPGAIRYYKEIGIWPEADAAQPAPAESTDAPAKAAE